MKILLIAGHGEGDPGACGNNLTEEACTREVARQLYAILKHYADVTLYNTSLNCYKQSKKGNVPRYQDYDYVIEIHFNSSDNSSAHGTEILVHPNESGVSVEECILRNLSAYFTNRGVKRRSDLLNMNNCNARGVSYAILETCFISNAGDMATMSSYSSAIVNAIASAITEGFGIEHNSDNYEPPKAESNLYRVQCGAFRVKKYADELSAKLKEKGFDNFIKNEGGMYKVQTGAYSKKENAIAQAEDLKSLGFDAFVK